MISYIKGKVDLISEGFIILECAGIGYKISMPASSMHKITMGGEVCVYTYMSVKEDGISLYGFITVQERAMFEMLLCVSGIGPKGALSILSSVSVSELKSAVEAEDSRLIASAKGVGNKTAQKIVLELKGKIEKNAAFANDVPGESYQGPGLSETSGAAKAAADVLEALGFMRSAAVRAVKAVYLSEDMTREEIVNEALKIID